MDNIPDKEGKGSDEGQPQTAAPPAPDRAQPWSSRYYPGRGRDRLAYAAQAAGAAVARSAPVVASVAGRFGRWLASIGWGKFAILSLLLLILSSILEEQLHKSQPSPRVKVPVEVVINVDRNGMHIAAPGAPTPPAPPSALRAPPTPPKPGGPQDWGQDQAKQEVPVPSVDEPAISVDDNGVRLRADKDGHKVTVVIDRKGIRVDDKASSKEHGGDQANAAAGAEPGGESVTVAPLALVDSDKVDEAVEAAHDRIESIVKKQVEAKLAAIDPSEMHHSHPEDSDYAGLAFLVIFTLMIVKIALGSKQKAESRAQVADAVAAEEGLKRQLAEAQLKTMQAQVEPHFLFNTLASVDYLIETDPARASRMQKNLIQYLRAALPQMRQGSSTLGQELALCRSYLEILKVRMDERLQFTITMPAGLSNAAFPPMMLQTLVENSIKHGLEPKPDGGTLNLNAAVVDGMVRVSVSDTGLGFGVAGAGGTGVGLNNIRERLLAMFGSRARLTIEPNHPTGTIATIEVPYSVSAQPAPAAPAGPPGPGAAAADSTPQPPAAASPA